MWVYSLRPLFSTKRDINVPGKKASYVCSEIEGRRRLEIKLEVGKIKNENVDVLSSLIFYAKKKKKEKRIYPVKNELC